MTDAGTLGHLLEWDTVHGRFSESVEASDDHLVVDGENESRTAPPWLPGPSSRRSAPSSSGGPAKRCRNRHPHAPDELDTIEKPLPSVQPGGTFCKRHPRKAHPWVTSGANKGNRGWHRICIRDCESRRAERFAGVRTTEGGNDDGMGEDSRRRLASPPAGRRPARRGSSVRPRPPRLTPLPSGARRWHARPGRGVRGRLVGLRDPG